MSLIRNKFYYLVFVTVFAYMLFLIADGFSLYQQVNETIVYKKDDYTGEW